MRFHLSASAQFAPVAASVNALASLRADRAERNLRASVKTRVALVHDLRAGALMFCATFAVVALVTLARAAGVC